MQQKKAKEQEIPQLHSKHLKANFKHLNVPISHHATLATTVIPTPTPPINDVTTALNNIPTNNVTSVTDGPRRMHVTNLPFKVRDNELRTMFEVSVHFIINGGV